MLKIAFRLVVLAAVLLGVAVAPSLASPGVLTSGGDTRSGIDLKVQDSLGAPVAGGAAGTDVRVDSGVIPGLPETTPVELRRFHFTAGPEGVEIAWEGNPESRIFGFFLERAMGPGGEPDDSEYQRIDERFPGVGPHRYLDTDVRPGETWYYRLRGVYDLEHDDTFGPWSITVEDAPIGFAAKVLSPAPNPFREAFVVRVVLAEPSSVSWTLVDVQGRQLLRGSIGGLGPGYHALTVDPHRDVAAGIYFLHVQAGKMKEVLKIAKVP